MLHRILSERIFKKVNSMKELMLLLRTFEDLLMKRKKTTRDEVKRHPRFNNFMKNFNNAFTWVETESERRDVPERSGRSYFDERTGWGERSIEMVKRTVRRGQIVAKPEDKLWIALEFGNFPLLKKLAYNFLYQDFDADDWPSGEYVLRNFLS